MAAPVSADDVARLFGRAAFGAASTDFTTWVGQDYATMVDSLFPLVTTLPDLADEARRTQLESATTDLLAGQRWWLNRMATTHNPLTERMTLFWHTHFATAYTGDVTVGDLVKQNKTIRTNALGDFRQLVYQLTIDPAMLVWLSGNLNRNGAVNENYGRELLELFTMGTKPQLYTETDIREAAKALTGWVLNSNRKATFQDGRHVHGTKSVLGATVGGHPSGDAANATEYQEVVNVALNQASVATFVAYKMVCSFAYVPASTDLINDPDPLVDAVAAAFKPAVSTGVWDITAALKTLFKHDAFRYPDYANGKAVIRSPIELVVHMSKPMGVNLDPLGGINNTNAYNNNIPIIALRRMGQVPLQPPNVGGWPKGKQWLSAITTQGRYDLGQYMISAYNNQNRKNTNPLPASGDVAGWTSFLGLGSLSAVTAAQVSAYLANPGTTAEATKQNSMLLLLTGSPDWQVM